MTSLRLVERHVSALRDIRAILNSMKSLAYMKVQKLSHIVPSQRAVSRQINTAATDLIAHFPAVLPPATPSERIIIVLGTERGFCGNHNQRLMQTISDEMQRPGAHANRIIAVGGKLHATLEGSGIDQAVLLDGAGVTEEVPPVLNQIVDQLEEMRRTSGPAAVAAMYINTSGELCVRKLLPPAFDDPAPAAADVSHPPVLNIEPQQLLLELSEQSLFSSLFEVLYESLLTENQRRVQHLGDAVRHLDKQTVELTNKHNALRQEQITEEIEVLLLSSGLAGRQRDQSSRLPTD